MGRIGKTYPRHEVWRQSALPGGPAHLLFADKVRGLRGKFARRAPEALWLLAILASVLFFWP